MAVERGCPDDGACHHDCGRACFRVLTCEPLSDVYPNDEWPDALVGAHRALDEMNDLRDRLTKAVGELEKLKDGIDPHGLVRISGKIEGVKVALSYIEEIERR